MILVKTIQFKVIPSTRKYYNSKGYNCKNGDTIEIKIEDLPITSGLKLPVKCEKCGEERELTYKHYVKNTKDFTQIYTCSKCCIFKNKLTKLVKYGDENYQNIEKIKKTKLEKYGDPNYTGRDKAKKTCLEKYGIDNISKLDSVKQKKKDTNLKNWGVDCVFKSEVIKEKISETINKKYGVNWYSKTDDFKEKYKEFCNKLGVEHYSKSQEYREKFEKTCLLNFGFKTNLLSPEIKEQIKSILLEKYGVVHPMKNKDLKLKNVEKIIKGRFNYFTKIEFEALNYDYDNKIYTLKRNECGHVFNTDYDLFRSRIKWQNNPCLVCCPKDDLTSMKEKEIGDFLKELKVNYLTGNRTILDGKELDFFIEEYNLAIEFNGLYWHSDKFKDEKYHQNKSIKCLDKKIQLLHIWEDDWFNKKEIIKSIIKGKLGLNKKINSKDLTVEIISKEEANKFLEMNHIEGGVKMSISICLKLNNEIISIMSFCKRRETGRIELVRYCDRVNLEVENSFTILLDYFKKNYDYKEIITYQDLAFNDSKIYENYGFILEGYTKINIYWTDLNKKYNDFYFNKNKITELGYEGNNINEILKNNGYYKIYGCSKYKLKLNIYKYEENNYLAKI